MVTYSIKSGDRFIVEVNSPILVDDFQKEGLLWTVRGADAVHTRLAEADLVKVIKIPESVSCQDSPVFGAGYQAGVDKVWGVMSELQKLSLEQIMEIFGTAAIDKILALGYQEIDKKITDYKSNRIKIGDEVNIVLAGQEDIVGIYLGNDGHWTYVLTLSDEIPRPVKTDDIMATAKTGRRAIVCAEGGVPNKDEKR